MKWISLVLALTLVISALIVTANANTSIALSIPDAKAPESIIDAYEVYGDIYEDFKLVSFHCDECALVGAIRHGGDTEATPAIGRFSAENGDGYATDWDSVVANSGVCKDPLGNIVTHFYLIGDTNVTSTMDFGRTGRALTVDGSLGEVRSNRNYKISNSSTLFTINGGPSTRLTFKDVILETTNAKCAIKIPSESGSRVGGSLILDEGSEIKSSGIGILIEETKFSVEINGATIKSCSEAVSLLGLQSTVSINSGTFVSYDFNGTDAALSESSVNGEAPTAKRVLYSSDGEISVFGGDFYIYKTEMSVESDALADIGAHALSYGNGSITVYCGNFHGGQYLVFQAGVASYNEVSDKYAMPADGNCKLSGIYTKEGASVRTVAGSSGMRFEGGIEADYVDYIRGYLARSDEDFYIGIAIAPKTAVDSAGEFTFSSLAPDNYVTTKANKGLVYNEDNTYTLRISLVDIREKNYSREFVAIAYAGFESDGVEGLSSNDTIFYASATSGARSILDVAAAALADVTDTATEKDGVSYATQIANFYFVKNDDTYVKTPIYEGIVKFSRYNTVQLGVLRSYFAE